jgi:YD repeat-containing protein
VTTKSNFAVFILSLVVWITCVKTAQACVDKLPPGGACVKGFTFFQGDLFLPGYVCGCGLGAPDGFTTCQVAMCSTHDCPTCSNQGGSPINLSTGNTYITQQDIKIPGVGGGLILSRTWNSILRSSLSNVGMFGPGWRSTYEERIYVDDDNTIAYAHGDGNVWNFVMGSSPTFAPTAPANTLATYIPVAPANATAALFYSSASWTLILQNGEQRVFDGTSGNLLSIADRNGNTTRLTYDASYRLTTVTDPASRHVYFSYANPSSYLVTGVTSDVGVSLTYSYDGQGRLSQYAKPDRTTVSFQYGAANPTLITAVLDQNGKILESHSYDSLGRGLTSSRAGGVESITITYPLGALARP